MDEERRANFSSCDTPKSRARTVCDVMYVRSKYVRIRARSKEESLNKIGRDSGAKKEKRGRGKSRWEPFQRLRSLPPPLPMATKRGLVWWRDWRPDGLQGEEKQEQGLLMNSWCYLSAFPN